MDLVRCSSQMWDNAALDLKLVLNHVASEKSIEKIALYRT